MKQRRQCATCSHDKSLHAIHPKPDGAVVYLLEECTGHLCSCPMYKQAAYGERIKKLPPKGA